MAKSSLFSSLQVFLLKLGIVSFVARVVRLLRSHLRPSARGFV
jgi:hypothetical protein